MPFIVVLSLEMNTVGMQVLDMRFSVPFKVSLELRSGKDEIYFITRRVFIGDTSANGMQNFQVQYRVKVTAGLATVGHFLGDASSGLYTGSFRFRKRV